MAIRPITDFQASGTADINRGDNPKQPKSNDMQKSNNSRSPYDGPSAVYEKGREKKDSVMPGLYRVSEDEKGSSKIQFVPPHKEEKEEPKTTQCTANTDKVDGEIKSLKNEKQKIQQQIKQAAGDKDRQAELERRLSQLEAEIQSKDNDTYRKQNASYTNE